MTLRSFERRWLEIVAETILPRGGPPERLHSVADTMLARGPVALGLGLRLALWAIVLLPLLVHGRSFPGLAPGKRLAFLRRLRGSDVYLLRELPVVLKSIVAFAWAAPPP